ncbi:MAG: SH3 domain-containing protein [Anaerolineae bacterium]|nr:SH3 domain-containing protein [Anaerolineae bacterium]
MIKKYRLRSLLMLCLCLSFGSGALAQTESITATVYQSTNVRREPSAQSPVVGRLAPDLVVMVIARDDTANSWLLIVAEEDLEGWVPGFALVLQGDPATIPIYEADAVVESGEQVVIHAYGRINVRSGPGIDHEVVGQLNPGEIALAEARSTDDNDWLLIETEALRGWVAYFTVSVEGDLESLPVRVPVGNGELGSPELLIRARFNVRLHVSPELEGRVLTVVPYSSHVTPLARSDDSRWLYVRFEDVVGWGLVRLFNIGTEELRSIPVYEASEG